jgi:folate-binding Fe-S cluster repair protein YgfZ
MRTKLNIVCHLSRLRERNSASNLDGNNSHTIATNHATAIANKETHWTAPSQATATTYKEIKINQGAPRIRSSNG